MNYLKLPLPFSNLVEGKKMPVVSIGESISQFIFSVLHTRKGELHSDTEFGSSIWDLTYTNMLNRHTWEVEIAEEIENCLAEREARLKQTAVRISLKYVEASYALKKYPDARIKAEVQVTGRLVHNDEFFKFQTELYISPIANS